MKLLDGKIVREKKKELLRKNILLLSEPPVLVIIQVGNDSASNSYIEQKKKFGSAIGASVIHKVYPEEVKESDLVKEIENLNEDNEVHGIIVQLPMPDHINSDVVADSICWQKDVDGLSGESERRRLAGNKSHIPATARGISELLKEYGVEVRDKKVAVLGRSRLVGAPTAWLLDKEGAEVSICHSKTENVKEITRESDVVIVAIGKPRLIDDSYIAEGQVVVDVGITAVTEEGEKKLDDEILEYKLVGDVDFEDVKDKVSAISPVPGGVGPMTVVALFENLLDTH